MLKGKKYFLLVFKVFIFVFSLFFSYSCIAGSQSANFNVMANVVTYCNISTTDLTFPNYQPTAGTTSTASTSVVVTCTKNSAYSVGLSAGNGTGASYLSRSMKNGINSLNYNLYKDNTYLTTSSWGDQTDGASAMVAGTLVNSTSVTLPVYGQIPSGQTNVIAGTYSDIITASVYY